MRLTHTYPAMTDDDDFTKEKRARADARLRAITKAEWARIHKELLAWGLWRTKNPVRAQDLAQEAIMRVLDARWEPWDPDANPDLLLFLRSIINRNLANEKVTRRRHREIQMDAEDFNAIRDNARTPESIVATHDLADKRMTELRTRLAGDEEALERVDQFEQGVDSAEDQRADSDKEIEIIRNARRRVFFHAENVKREISAERDEALPAREPPRAVVRTAAAKTRVKRRRPAAPVPRGKARDEKPKPDEEEGEP